MKKYGKYSVLNLGHSQIEWTNIYKTHKEEILPHLKNMLNGSEKKILDFGCGVGRFTEDLANLINGKAVGIDIIEELLIKAPKSFNVEYKLIKKNSIDLPDKSIDVIWICLVLGGLHDSILKTSILEFERILKDKGLIFLIENTSTKKNSNYWFFRSVDEYQSFFPFINIQHIRDFYDLGERISIIAGRKI